MRSGKTLKIVIHAAMNRGVIITRSRKRAEQLKQMAVSLGLSIQEPMVFESKKAGYAGVTFAGVIIDEPKAREK